MSRDNRPYQVGMTIRQTGKGIPYGGYHEGEKNDDGTLKNVGFKNLKGRLDRLAEVPELADSSALFELVEAINQPECGLISVGCAAWHSLNERGARCEGYIEIAINSAEKIEDAQCYFPLFFHFNRMLHKDGFDQRVTYNWELEGAHFWPVKADGFTCAIWVYTPTFPALAEAKDAWEVALQPLIPFLGSFPQQPGRPLFTAETECGFGG